MNKITINFSDNVFIIIRDKAANENDTVKNTVEKCVLAWLIREEVLFLSKINNEDIVDDFFGGAK